MERNTKKGPRYIKRFRWAIIPAVVAAFFGSFFVVAGITTGLGFLRQSASAYEWKMVTLVLLAGILLSLGALAFFKQRWLIAIACCSTVILLDFLVA